MLSHKEMAPVPQEAADPQARELLHERAARLLREWDAFMACRDYGAARALVLGWSELDVELFLEVLGRRLRAEEAAGETAR